MTMPQPSESARLAQLEQRVQVLEDVNAIRHLKARYAAYCDDQYNPDGLAALFTEDAVWESQGLGRFEGREAIRAFFRGASQLFTFAIHYSLNGQIDVQGDTARAQWYLCHALHARRRQPGHVAGRGGSRGVRPGGRRVEVQAQNLCATLSHAF
jgi:limonene-1,2-epoxide hydrolase